MDSLNDMTLAQLDPEIQAVLDAELGRQRDTLEMIASENFVPRAVLEAQGIECSGKTARRLRRDDAEQWDLIVGMDEANMRDMRRQLGRGADGKLRKLLEFADLDRDVADPWYTGDFDATYDDVLAGCTGLLAWLTAGAARS